VESAYEDDGLETSNRQRIKACQLVMLNCKAKEEMITDLSVSMDLQKDLLLFLECIRFMESSLWSSFEIEWKSKPGSSDRAIGQSGKEANRNERKK